MTEAQLFVCAALLISAFAFAWSAVEGIRYVAAGHGDRDDISAITVIVMLVLLDLAAAGVIAR